MKLQWMLKIGLSLTTIMSASIGKAQALVPVNQGWSQEQRQMMYSKYEGSQIIPYDWFFAIEKKESIELLSENMSRFGFISNTDEKLPIGMTLTEDEVTSQLYGEKKWLGVNCTACHTTVMNFKSKSILVDGGTNPLQLYKFVKEIADAAQETVADKSKFARFAARLNQEPSDKLFNSLTSFAKDVEAQSSLNRFSSSDSTAPGSAYPPQMQDGITGPNNQTLCNLSDLGDLSLKNEISLSQNCREFTAPTGVPHIWGHYNEEYTHFLGNIHSAFGRNIGQAAGTYAKNWVEKDMNGKIVFKTTSDFAALIKIEETYKTLKAPEWKQFSDLELLPPLDTDLIERGRKVYTANNCIACHAIQPEITSKNIVFFGRSFWKTNVTPIDEINTDRARLDVDTKTVVQLPEILKVQFQDVFGKDSVNNGQVNASQYRAYVVRDMIMNYFERENLGNPAKYTASSCRLPDRNQAVIGYKAKSLEGIAFTAPYLHNDSVPTLSDLFLPVSKRPKKFYIGCRDFDAANVGFQCNKDSENSYEYNTELPGLSNTGHEYGTDLSELDRKALIEFLKSLRNPEAPSYGTCEKL